LFTTSSASLRAVFQFSFRHSCLLTSDGEMFFL
jgi:hypothetical protein